jgi:hypothetical protein
MYNIIYTTYNDFKFQSKSCTGNWKIIQEINYIQINYTCLTKCMYPLIL